MEMFNLYIQLESGAPVVARLVIMDSLNAEGEVFCRVGNLAIGTASPAQWTTISPR